VDTDVELQSSEALEESVPQERIALSAASDRDVSQVAASPRRLWGELLDGQAAEEVDEVAAVLPKNLRRQPLALLGRREDQQIQVTIPERLLVLMPRFQLLIPHPEAVGHSEHAADQPRAATARA
jgi:hypothetical protein